MYGNSDSKVVVVHQPVAFNNQVQPQMPDPVIRASIPPGLQHLTLLESIFIKQDLELIEIGFYEFHHNHWIRDEEQVQDLVLRWGAPVYIAKEESSCLARCCCGPIRGFEMNITDVQGMPVINLERPLRCGSFCCPCCGLQEMNVFAPPGVLCGSIVQTWNICPAFNILDALGNVVLTIKGPFCTCSCSCGNVEFKVLSADREIEVGKISKEWSGFLREAFTDADRFGISFPLDLSVKMKVVLIGACFLIDFMYYEKQQ